MSEPSANESPVAKGEPLDARPPLEYAPPVARSRNEVLVVGLALSVVYAFGAAMIAMGLMLGGFHQGPTFVAIGVFALVLATGVWMTLVNARR